MLIADDGRIHTTFNQTAATTGRLSSNNPNLQNIPIRTALGREIRACFVAEPGHLLVSADYSQVELRLLAHIAGEDALKEIFRKGEDVHTATACRVFGVTPEQIDPGMRSKAKMINYGIVYGLSAWGMADRLDIPQEEADEFIQRYLAGFPAVARWIEDTITQGPSTATSRLCSAAAARCPSSVRAAGAPQAGRAVRGEHGDPGTAADIMKVAMVRCDHAVKEAGLRSRMILQIHDELLFEGPAEEAEEVKRIASRRWQRVRDGSSARRRRGHRPGLARGEMTCAPTPGRGGEMNVRAVASALVMAAVIALAGRRTGRRAGDVHRRPDSRHSDRGAHPAHRGARQSARPSLQRRPGSALQPHPPDLLGARGLGAGV